MGKRDRYGENIVLRLGGYWWVIAVAFIGWILGIMLSLK